MAADREVVDHLVRKAFDAVQPSEYLMMASSASNEASVTNDIDLQKIADTFS